jgi:hypothetical protein
VNDVRTLQTHGKSRWITDARLMRVYPASSTVNSVKNDGPECVEESVPVPDGPAQFTLLDHKHITTTKIHDTRRRSVRDSASHKVPI